eukprot:6861301-Heterocapsa_arctica.AAC.1
MMRIKGAGSEAAIIESGGTYGAVRRSLLFSALDSMRPERSGAASEDASRAGGREATGPLGGARTRGTLLCSRFPACSSSRRERSHSA